MIPISGLVLCIVVLVMLALLMAAYIFFSNIRIGRKEKKNLYLKKTLGLLINKAIFYYDDEPEGAQMTIPPKHKRLLVDAGNRQYMIDEIVAAQRNLSGVAGANLKKLYEQLGLKNDSARNLTSSKWHIKAKAIQELAYMDQREYLDTFHTLINSKNDHIRIEAQLAVVHFLGMKGLGFLDVVSAPVTEWQQMHLLNLLEKQPGHEPDSAERWLKSGNDSVVSFTLKLISMYQLADLHDEVVKCLVHENHNVRMQAIECLAEIYNESTPGEFIRVYDTGDSRFQLLMLNALLKMEVGSHAEFLLQQLSHPDNNIKLVAARVLSRCCSSGISQLESSDHAQTYPWKNIIAQVKQEVAA